VAEEPLDAAGPKGTARSIVDAVAGQRLAQAQQLSEDTAQKLIHAIEGSQPVRRIRDSQIASAFLGTIGFALFVIGVEHAAEDIPVISNAYGSIGVGLVLLAVTGLLLRRLAGSE
jgi:hypothetical protein